MSHFSVNIAKRITSCYARISIEQMPHPFFDAPQYPWHLPAALDLHQALWRTVTLPNRIERLYNNCGPGLYPLNTQGPSDVIWQQALDALSSAGKLRVFCEQLINDPGLKAIAPQVSKVIGNTAAAPPPRKTLPGNHQFAYDVFLSHTGTDKPAVRDLAQKLHDAGLRVWFDEWVIQPGDDIYLAIERGLESSRVQVLCLSAHALASDWVSLERSAVLFRDPTNKDRRFIPLLLQDCELPAALKRYLYIDYRSQSSDALAKLISACK